MAGTWASFEPGMLGRHALFGVTMPACRIGASEIGAPAKRALLAGVPCQAAVPRRVLNLECMASVQCVLKKDFLRHVESF